METRRLFESFLVIICAALCGRSVKKQHISRGSGDMFRTGECGAFVLRRDGPRVQGRQEAVVRTVWILDLGRVNVML